MNDKVGIKCFTPHNDNLLMWSHYAKSHSGICIEFDVEKDCDFFVYPMPIKYQKEYPQINILGNDYTHKLLETKADVWSYENEVRVYKQSSGYHTFKPNSLVSVIFGCKCEKIKEITTEIANNVSLNHVMLYKATPNSSKYSLDINKL